MEQKTFNLFRKILRSVAPPQDILPSDWAEQNLVLNESALAAGKWRKHIIPYQQEIIDAAVDPEIEKIVIKASSQGGKSTIINIIIGYFIDIDPCPIMLIEPTLELAEDYSKRRLAPLIRDTKCLQIKVADVKSRDSNNTILLKLFPGGSLNIVGANSPRTLASKPIRIIIADEVDGFPPSAGTEGDPLELADRRSITYWNRKKIYVSSPGIKDISRIDDEYQAGTQEKWRLKCPCCGNYQYINLYGIKFQHSKDEKGNYLIWDLEFQCPDCLEKFDEYTWKAQPGAWVADNPKAKKVRSFHWNAFVSPGWTWEAIILEWLKVKNDPEKYKVFKNTVLGEVWEPKGEIDDIQYLLDRREEYPAELPDGVLLLTAGVDVQDDRFEYEIAGWGKGEQSWGIEYGFIMGSPEQKSTWQLLSDKLDTIYRFQTGLGLKIACACIDSGGHFTTEVYKYSKAWEHRRIFAVKGMGGPGIPLIYKVYRSKQENAAVFILGVDSGKSKIMSRLKIIQPGDGYCHFPCQEERGYDQIYFQGLVSERLVIRKVKGQMRSVWEKMSSNQRNEPLDVRNYAQAALAILNPNFDALERRLQSNINLNQSVSRLQQKSIKKLFVKKSSYV